MEHKINDRFSYTEEKDSTGRQFYNLWDYSKMHGSGSMKSPTNVYTSYSLAWVKTKAKSLMQKKVTRIRITGIFTDWQGKMRERYMNETLFLRTAREVGDEENVNNYVLGLLNRAQEDGQISFEKVNQ